MQLARRSLRIHSNVSLNRSRSASNRTPHPWQYLFHLPDRKWGAAGKCRKSKPQSRTLYLNTTSLEDKGKPLTYAHIRTSLEGIYIVWNYFRNVHPTHLRMILCVCATADFFPCLLHSACFVPDTVVVSDAWERVRSSAGHKQFSLLITSGEMGGGDWGKGGGWHCPSSSYKSSARATLNRTLECTNCKGCSTRLWPTGLLLSFRNPPHPHPQHISHLLRPNNAPQSPHTLCY